MLNFEIFIFIRLAGFVNQLFNLSNFAPKNGV